MQRQELEFERARASQLGDNDRCQIKADQIKVKSKIKSVLPGRAINAPVKGRASSAAFSCNINCSQASYLWTVAATGLAAADTAVEAAVGLGEGEGVDVGEAAGSRTSWSVAVVCSAMPKLRHQEGKHELSRQEARE